MVVMAAAMLEHAGFGCMTTARDDPRFGTGTDAQHSAGLAFVSIPAVSQRYISPVTTPGEGDTTILSYSVNHDVNFTVNISSYYEPINQRSSFYTKEVAAYCMPNGTWLVVAVPARIGSGDPTNMMLGTGTSASNLTWRDVGLVNYTAGMAVAATGQRIAIVYIEKATSGTGEWTTWPSRWVKYFLSDDFGTNWQGGTIWDCSAWANTWLTGPSLAAWNGNFSCAWGFSNTSASGLKQAMSTTWMSAHAGPASSPWTSASNLTCFALQGMHTSWPQLIQNQNNGTLYIGVNNATDGVGNQLGVLCRLGSRIDAPSWNGTWQLTPNPVTDTMPLAETAIDSVTGAFYFLNRTGEEGVYSAASWNGTIAFAEHCWTGFDSSIVNLFAANGPKLFSPYTLTPKGAFHPGILDCETPFLLRSFSGNISAFTPYSMAFDGRNQAGAYRGSRGYYLVIHAASAGLGILESGIVVGVDDVIATVNVVASATAISPFASPGSNDVLRTDVTASKPGKATLVVESNGEAIPAISNLTDGEDSYTWVSLCGDGRNNHAFITASDGFNNNKVMLSRTFDGGLTWSAHKTIFQTVERILAIKTVSDRQQVYCFVHDEVSYNLLFSVDGGETFITTILSDIPDAVSSDGACWIGTRNATHFTIRKSTDHGFTYAPFLALNQSTLAGRYSLLDGAAFDPVSGNYSFVMTNGSTRACMLVIVAHDGTQPIIAEDLCAGGSPLATNFAHLVEVDARAGPGPGNETEWVITNALYNTISTATLTSPLAYRVAAGNGSLGTWGNFIAITGALLPATLYFWDIEVPYSTTPFFANIMYDTALMIGKQVTAFASTNLVFSHEVPLAAGITSTINFAGISSNNEILPDGTYDWAVHFVDTVGQVVSWPGTITIDNTGPAITAPAPFTTPAVPVPGNPTVITIAASDANLNQGTLSYRTSPTSAWINASMDKTAAGPGAATFTSTISPLAVATVYWRVTINDTAGNVAVVDNNGQPFSYRAPNIQIQDESEPADWMDLGADGQYTVTVVITNDAEFVDHIEIHFTFDDDAGPHVASLTRVSGSLFTFTFTPGNVPSTATLLSYTLTAVDINGAEAELGASTARVLGIIPPLPEWSISGDQQLLIVIVSLVAGACSGLVFAAIIKQKKPLRKVMLELEAREAKHHHANVAGALAASGATTGVLLSIATYTVVSLERYEVAMLALAGAFLSAVLFWMLLNVLSILSTFDRKRKNLAGLPLLFMVGISLFVLLLGILVVGNNVSWWRVRVNQAAYSFGAFTIPRMLTTLLSTFFSSIIVLTWSISKDVKRVLKELAEAEQHNVNPGWLLARRETQSSRLLGSIGMKGLIFVAIIGITIIFASDLSAYAVQGLLIILPFVVGTVALLGVSAVYSRWRQRKENHLVFDNLMTCSSCGKATALGGSYCEDCGARLVAGTRKEEGTHCAHCGMIDPVGAKRCRFCGEPMEPGAISNEAISKATPGSPGSTKH